MKELRQALRVQGRVLYALILREALAKYGKTRIGYLWALLEPLIQVLMLVAIFSALGRSSPVGGDLAVFFTTGIVPWLMYSSLSSRMSGALGANQALLSYPHVTPFDVLAGRALLESVTLLVVFVLIVTALRIAGKAFAVYDLFHVLMGLMVLIFFSAGIGMINSAVRIYFDSWDKLFSAFNRPLYFLSGIFFTAASLPPQGREYLQWNPIFQCVEWVRSGFFSTYQNTYINYGYAVGCAATLFLVGLVLTQYTRHKARNL
ncbi:ABC transporter permease [Vibrio europaeus]|uniref:Transport permease protein n=1 Tax=Vibrio europaeus TaxID=300876 RepID=A0AAE7AY18_9VIBR|nr:ABC transporter permease [Vibrio europaeus]QJY38878.1 ABC transporter permease [Vibrio europaeus]